MVKYKNDVRVAKALGLRGGNGEIEMMHLFENAELDGRTDLFSLTTVNPGDSVGYHQHVTNCEVYVVLEGELTVTEDDVPYTLHPGDVEFCPPGHFHGVENKSDKPARFIAVVFSA